MWNISVRAEHISQLRTDCGLSNLQIVLTDSEHHMLVCSENIKIPQLSQPTVSLTESRNGAADVLLRQCIN